MPRSLVHVSLADVEASSALVTALLDAREAHAVWTAERMAAERRGAAANLVGKLGAFFAVYDATADAAARLEAAYVPPARGESSEEAFQEEMELLNADRPLTFDGLKTAYRSAALRHHPDRGGDTETMQRVVAAYETLHYTLTMGPGGTGGGGPGDLAAPTSESVVRAARSIWFETALDVYDLDAVVAAYRSMVDADGVDKVWRRDGGELARALPTVALFFVAAGRVDEGDWLLREVERGVEGRTAGWLSRRGVSKTYLDQARSRVNGEPGRRPAVTRHHIVISENLHRLGLLSDSGLATARKREAKRAGLRADMTARLRGYAEEPGFLVVERDGSPVAGAPGVLAPHPLYEDDAIRLTPRQRGAYARAVSAETDWRLFRAYELVRLRSLVRALADDDDPIVLLRVVREIELISRANGADQARDFTLKLCNGVTDLARRLASLPPQRRAEAREIVARAERELTPTESSMSGGRPMSPKWIDRVIEAVG